MRENLSDAALVVIGHGTGLDDGSTLAVIRHAAELRRRGIFAGVHEAFWKREPRVKQVLAAVTAPRLFIVPFFISEGYFSREVIPRELGFSVESMRDTAASIWFYCRPVGTHDRVTDVILVRAREVVEQFPFPRAPKPGDTTLFIAGHGTERNGNSRKSIERQVDLIRARQLYAAVHAVFMDEEPRIPVVFAMARTRHLVVVPFFAGDGPHVVRDIPVLLGEPERIVRQRHAVGQPTWRNPTEKYGKLAWYSPAVGSEPRMAEAILERVRERAGTEAGG
jgi:sirohydrochlorin cobaltochelatase